MALAVEPCTRSPGWSCPLYQMYQVQPTRAYCLCGLDAHNSAVHRNFHICGSFVLTALRLQQPPSPAFARSKRSFLDDNSNPALASSPLPKIVALFSYTCVPHLGYVFAYRPALPCLFVSLLLPQQLQQPEQDSYRRQPGRPRELSAISKHDRNAVSTRRQDGEEQHAAAGVKRQLC
jgi:hypothetical protein